MCWREPNQQELAGDFVRANQFLPADSALLPRLVTIIELNNGVNLDEVLNSASFRSSSSNYHKRLLSYAALDLEAYKYAFEIVRSIDENDTLDLLMLAPDISRDKVLEFFLLNDIASVFHYVHLGTNFLGELYVSASAPVRNIEHLFGREEKAFPKLRM